MELPQLGNAKTIDEVIQQMDAIITWSIEKKCRLGYFAALYRKVTVQVKEGIRTGYFDDSPRMERLDVIFANRYLDALHAYLHGKQTSTSWMVAFAQGTKWRPLILQHLLLGMNAHINLDLGIAAAETCPGEQIHALHGDFLRINAVLASLVEEVQSEIDELSPWIGFLDRISPDAATDAIINFSMEKARESAWNFACLLAPLHESETSAAIEEKDKQTSLLGQMVAVPPGFLFGLGLGLIRLRETDDIAHQIEVLNRRKQITTPTGIGLTL